MPEEGSEGTGIYDELTSDGFDCLSLTRSELAVRPGTHRLKAKHCSATIQEVFSCAGQAAGRFSFADAQRLT